MRKEITDDPDEVGSDSSVGKPILSPDEIKFLSSPFLMRTILIAAETATVLAESMVTRDICFCGALDMEYIYCPFTISQFSMLSSLPSFKNISKMPRNAAKSPAGPVSTMHVANHSLDFVSTSLLWTSADDRQPI